ncbi:MAG: DHH family phosphoesterase [Clostridiales bacterium]|nr:DHH family phosphoesterase [Clostridiales bacterium]
MMIDIKEAAEYFIANDNFLLLSHIRPDGDTLGSAAALARALTAMGKRVNHLCGDTIGKDFEFMFDGLELTEFETSHVVAVDVADTKLLGEEVKAKYGNRVELCIDHHASNCIYAQKTFLEQDSASVAEMVYLLLCEMKADITPVIASCLFTGVTTDTGCFRFSNTTLRTFEIAAELVKAGADSYGIITTFFETKTKNFAALERLALDSMKFFLDDRCAVICITRDMFEKSGTDETQTDRLSNLPRQIEGVLVGVMIKELKTGEFKASVRTHGDVKASEICALLGGGGHAGAAACTVDGPKEHAINALVNAVESVLNRND